MQKINSNITNKGYIKIILNNNFYQRNFKKN